MHQITSQQGWIGNLNSGLKENLNWAATFRGAQAMVPIMIIKAWAKGHREYHCRKTM